MNAEELRVELVGLPDVRKPPSRWRSSRAPVVRPVKASASQRFSGTHRRFARRGAAANGRSRCCTAPGNRHPIPTTAIGSVSPCSATSSRSVVIDLAQRIGDDRPAVRLLDMTLNSAFRKLRKQLVIAGSSYSSTSSVSASTNSGSTPARVAGQRLDARVSRRSPTSAAARQRIRSRAAAGDAHPANPCRTGRIPRWDQCLPGSPSPPIPVRSRERLPDSGVHGSASEVERNFVLTPPVPPTPSPADSVCNRSSTMCSAARVR